MLASTILSCSGPRSKHGPPPRIDVRGAAFVFSMHGGPLPDARISILELPDRTTTTDVEGSFEFKDLPGETDLTFIAQAARVNDTLTATFRSSTSLENVTIQAPDPDTYSLLSTLTNITPRADRCQIAATVTRAAVTGNDTGGNGEPGATVTIDPPIPSDALGPVYFNAVTDTFIFPDETLASTSSDGGLLFLNVPPGEYTLTAHKEGATFTEAHLKCLAGLLTNAAPPWGPSALTGGIGPRVDASP